MKGLGVDGLRIGIPRVRVVGGLVEVGMVVGIGFGLKIGRVSRSGDETFRPRSVLERIDSPEDLEVDIVGLEVADAAKHTDSDEPEPAVFRFVGEGVTRVGFLGGIVEAEFGSGGFESQARIGIVAVGRKLVLSKSPSSTLVLKLGELVEVHQESAGFGRRVFDVVVAVGRLSPYERH